MHLTAFRRIVWKECRAQSSLWVALLLGAVLLQAVIINMRVGLFSLTQPWWAPGLLLTACFMVASVALLFAGEAEDGTRDWLLQLPARPGVVIVAKLCFTVVAGALLLAATTLTAHVLLRVALRTGGDLASSNLEVLAQSVVGLFAWGLLCSALSRRILPTLLAAAAAEIIVVGLTDNLVSPILAEALWNRQSTGQIQTALHLGVTACVLVAGLVATRRWAVVGPSGRVTRVPRKSGSLSMPVSDLFAGPWLRLVAWAAQRGAPAARETAVLAWREARAAVPFAVVWCLVGLFVTDVLSILGEGAIRARPLQPLFLLATPVLCGLMTCARDQRQQTFRFLAERGVSPARVWSIKTCVWLLLAIVVVLLFLRWDSTAADRLRAGNSGDVSLLMMFMASIHEPTLALPAGTRGYDSPEDLALQFQYLWATGLMLFAAGQCASFWIRRTILALATLVIAVPVIVVWNYMLAAGDVPFGLASWPLTIALMAATLIGAGAWLRGCDSWTLRTVRLAAIVLPVCAVATAAAAHRAFSVPPAFVPFANAAEAHRLQRFASAARISPEWSQRWRKALADFRMPVDLNRFSSPERRRELREEFIALSERIAAHPDLLDPLVLSPDTPVSVQNVGALLAAPPLRTPASEVADDGSPVMATQGATIEPSAPPEPLSEAVADQWRAYAAGMRITRYLSDECASADQWIDIQRGRVPLLTAIREWSQRADQTPEALQQAFDFLAQDLVTPIGVRTMAINRYAFYQQLLAHQGPTWDKYKDELSSGQILDPVPMSAVSCAALPWYERMRTANLIGHVTNEFLKNEVRIEGAPPPPTVPQLHRWIASTGYFPIAVTTEVPANPDAPMNIWPFTLEGTFRSVNTQAAGTALVVALQRHRLLHGEFPARLSDVIPDQYSSGWPFMDRHADVPFGYEPQGLPGDLYLAGGRVIRAGQPLLWSAGVGNHRIGQSVAPIATGSPDGLVVPRGVYYATGNDLRLPQGDFRFEDARPDRIEFINVGIQPTW